MFSTAAEEEGIDGNRLPLLAGEELEHNRNTKCKHETLCPRWTYLPYSGEPSDEKYRIRIARNLET